MKKLKKKRILLIFCCIILIFIVWYQYEYGNKKGKQKIADYVTIEEALNSINTLYGAENYVKPDQINVKSEKLDEIITRENTKKIMKGLKISDDLTAKIDALISKDTEITRTKWGKILMLLSDTTGIENTCIEDDINVYATSSIISTVPKGQIISDAGIYEYSFSKYKLEKNQLHVLRRDQTIIFIMKVSEKKLSLNNVLIVSAADDKVTTSLAGYQQTFKIKGLKENLQNTIADIEIKDDKVIKMAIKRDSISGKVLAIDNQGVEVEGFGKVPFSEKFRIFNQINNFEETDISKISVGLENVKFIVGDKMICAAILQSPINTQKIRVLIKSTGFKDIYHDNVVISCSSGFTMNYYVKDETGNNKEMTNQYKPDEEVGLDINNDILSYGRVKITPDDKNAKLVVKSIIRNGDNPQYRGDLEVSKTNDKLIIINELPLEEYLYAVVPSEMPSSYGVEALKVQAVCARSYAISHLNNTKLSGYGAQVDDSTDYQVYNNTPETDTSIQAVQQTNGQVLMYGDQIANTYFYATSCGCTTDSAIWGDENLPYIQARLLTSSNDSMFLQDNNTFSEFIKSNYPSYDSNNGWYRWNIKFSKKQLSRSINDNLSNMYQNNKQRILTLDADGTFKSKNISSLGDISEINITQRGGGGIIDELVIKGDKNTVKVVKQSTIRNLINPYGISINKCDGSVNDKMTSLPSAFFTVEKQADGESFMFYGGGYGHGAGMSQTAVKSMIQDQKTYDCILKFFFTNVDIKSVY